MEPVKVGIREFRERLAAYLLEGDAPVGQIDDRPSGLDGGGGQRAHPVLGPGGSPRLTRSGPLLAGALPCHLHPHLSLGGRERLFDAQHFQVRELGGAEPLELRHLHPPRLQGDPVLGHQRRDDGAARDPAFGAFIRGHVNLVDLSGRGREQPGGRDAVHRPEKPLDLFGHNLFRHRHGYSAHANGAPLSKRTIGSIVHAAGSHRRIPDLRTTEAQPNV